MSYTIKVCNRIDSLNHRIGKVVSWFSFLMVVLITSDVALRHVFNKGFIALQEMEWHLFAVLFLLGGGFTLRHNGHVRVDIFYQRLGRRGKALVNLLGCLLFLFPGCYLVVNASVPFIQSSWSIQEISPDPGGLPGRYVLKAMIPIGFGLIALQGVSLTLRSIHTLFGSAERPGGQD
jgi:TRAP-type mannitol/chloroaromatic compound transport system permease small subunit